MPAMKVQMAKIMIPARKRTTGLGFQYGFLTDFAGIRLDRSMNHSHSSGGLIVDKGHQSSQPEGNCRFENHRW